MSDRNLFSVRVGEVVVSEQMSYEDTEDCKVAGILWFGFEQWDRSVLLFGICPYIKYCKLWHVTFHISVTNT